MNDKLRKSLINGFKESIEPPYTGSIAEWGKDYISLPPNFAIQGSFDISLSNYLRSPMEDLRNPNVNQINLVGATQTGKTLVSEIFIPYIIINSPGPILRLHQTDEMAQLFVETRLLPLLDNCKPVKSIIVNHRFSAKKTGINLPHMAVKIGGAKDNLLHGSSVRYLLMDEVWLYSQQVVEKAKARTTAFGNNKKILLTSQPGEEGDQLDEENRGLIYEWGWRCPHCQTTQSYYWSKEKENNGGW